MIDYALWEVIENGATLPKIKVIKGVTIELKFNSIKDAKKLLEAVEKRFGGNAATKKTQGNLGLGYENYTTVPPPYIGNFMPRKPDLSFTGLDEFANKPVDENVKAKFSKEGSKAVRKNNNALIIREWVSDDEEENNSSGLLLWPKNINGEAQIHVRVDGKKVIILEASLRRDLQFADEEGVDCLPNSTIFEQLASMGTMASAIICLATNHKFNLSKWNFESTGRNLDNLSGKFLMYPRNMRSIGKGFSGRITPLFPIMMVQSQLDEVVYKELGDSLVRAVTTVSSLEAEQDSGGGPGCQEAMGDSIAQTRFKNVSKLFNDSLLARGDKQSLGEDTSKQERRIGSIDVDENITLVSVQDDAKMFDADIDLVGEEVFVEQEVVDDKEKIDEVTLAQALAKLKTSKPKVKGVVIHEPSESLITTTTIPKHQSLDKGKAIMIEEHVKHKKKDQIRLDEKAALKWQAELQAEFDEEQKLLRERAQKEKEANIALIET
nr:hypothetical protein [Tanacetum cinerariifolium]